MLRILCAVLVVWLTVGYLGCSKTNKAPIKEDTAANPPPEIMNIPKPDQLPAQGQTTPMGQR